MQVGGWHILVLTYIAWNVKRGLKLLCNSLGYQLLWELVWPIHIVAACDDDGQLVACNVSLAEHLRTSLCCRVRVGGVQVAVL